MNKSICLFTGAILIGSLCIGQDLGYVKSMVDSLCSPRYHGRGYVERGDVKAAAFIRREVESIGVDNPVELLPFKLGVNTFPGKMYVASNKQVFQTGVDYIIDPKSGGAKGAFDVTYFKPKWANDAEKLFNLVASGKFENQIVVFDTDSENTDFQTLISDVYKNPLKAKGYVILTKKKLTWGVSRSMISFPIIRMRSEAVKKKMKRLNLHIDQHFESNHEGQNVMVKLNGTSDSLKKSIVYTAHLDHLGRMGAETYIAGANDNASGSAMLLDLYKHYRTHRPERDLVFLWFGGEEAGLVGSKHFVDHAPIELAEIEFLLNLDLMGDAKTGITVVNGKVFDDHFARLSSLNMELGLLDKVKARGPAANSDHHPFYEKGVPSFFIYTTGEYKHYHDVDDIPAHLPYTNYDKVFRLITDFAKLGL